MTDLDLMKLIADSTTMSDAELLTAARELLSQTEVPATALRDAGEAVIGLCKDDPHAGIVAGIALLARLAGVDAGPRLRGVEAQLAASPAERSAPLH